MKKLISLALVAMVAMVATMTFVSCGSDDNDTPSTFTLTGKIESNNLPIEVTSAVVKYFQDVVGSDASVLTSNNSTISISGAYDKKETVIAKIKAADQSALDTALDNLLCTMMVTINITDGTTAVRGISYLISGEKLFQGTFTSTINNVDYKIVFGDKIDSTHLNATITVGKDSYKGQLVALNYSSSFVIASDEVSDNVPVVNLISKVGVTDAFSDDISSFTINVYNKDELVAENATFTRQK